jgi:2-keto-4-pentenoate hydratase/2-oxohepta-3-ene-1,7-dioic acid hydratase in catechol pathway
VNAAPSAAGLHRRRGSRDYRRSRSRPAKPKARPDGSTRDMIFPVARLIAYLASYLMLEPGDVIATGAPAGVGAFRKPPRYLAPGDVVRLEIAEIGVLENHVVGGG